MNAPHMLPTAALADACVRANVTLRIAPQGMAPIVPQWKVSGRVVPVRHYGSVDVFLEALGHAGSGDVLVVDNEGRKDEGCIGDQVTLETKLAGLGGIVIWGLHRDTHDIRELGLPLFSNGCVPCGPTRVDPRAPDVREWPARQDGKFPGERSGEIPRAPLRPLEGDRAGQLNASRGRIRGRERCSRPQR